MNRVCLAVALAMALILFVSSASAATITGRTYYFKEQCETQKEFIELCADYDGTYFVDFEGPGSEWVAHAPESFSLNEGECQEIVLFVTPECYANSGVYDFEMVVSGAESLTEDMRITVSQIHDETLVVSPLTNTSQACEENTYNVTVTNRSDYKGEFVLTAEGLPSAWVDLENGPFVLDPYEVRGFIMKITPNCSAEPESREFELRVSNTLTNSSDSVFLVQNVVDFVPFATEGLPRLINSCSEYEENLEFTITNTSEYADEFNLTFSGPEHVTIDKDTIFLKPGEYETVTMTISASDVNIHTFALDVYSQKYRRTFTVDGLLYMLDCFSVNVTRGMTPGEHCDGRFEESFTVYNTGTHDTNVTFESDNMVGDFSLEMKSGEAKDIVLYFESGVLGRNEIRVLVTTPYSAIWADFNIDIIDCTSYDVEAMAQIETDCNQGELFPIRITNTSVADHIIDVNSSGVSWVMFSEDTIGVGAGETGIVYMYVPPNAKESGTFDTLLTIDNRRGLVKEIPVRITLTGDCIPKDYAWYTGPVIREAIFDLNFYNDSNLPTEVYNVTIEGFDFKSNFQPMTLDPFEERIIHFDVTLPDSFEEKIFDAEVVASTSLGERRFTQKVVVRERPAPILGGLFGLMEGVGIASLILVLILIGLAVYALAPMRKGRKGAKPAKARPKKEGKAKPAKAKKTGPKKMGPIAVPQKAKPAKTEKAKARPKAAKQGKPAKAKPAKKQAKKPAKAGPAKKTRPKKAVKRAKKK